MSRNVSKTMMEAISVAYFDHILEMDPWSVYYDLLVTLLKVTNSPIGFVGEIIDSSLRVGAYVKVQDNIIPPPHMILKKQEKSKILDKSLCLKKPSVLKDIKDPLFGFLSPNQGYFKQLYLAPLFSGGERMGVIGLSSKRGGYSVREMRFFSPLIRTIAHLMRTCKIDDDLKKNLQALKESNYELERYAHICAHDLKEPLRTISSFCQILLEDPTQSESCLKHIVDGTYRMKVLVDDMLKYSQVRNTALPMGKVVLKDLIYNVERDLIGLIDKKNGKIKTHFISNEITGIKTQIVQLFENIISNALKFNVSSNPLAEITQKEQGDFWLFCIKDNGVGIEQQYLERIFEMLFRLESRRYYEGTGLGLSLAKKIVNAHGGTIWAESDASGTTIHFTLLKKL